jgi:TPR repeat protein
MRYAQLLMQDHPGDRAVTLDQAIPLLKLAAGTGMQGATFLLGIAYGQLEDTSNARYWLKQAEAAGDSDATRVLRQYGFE